MTLFIVDSSPIILSRLKMILSEIPNIEILGHAQDSQKAINAIRKLCPDVILLDTQLEDGKGFVILKNIKESNLKSKIFVITEQNYPQYQKICFDMGVDFFFDKISEINDTIATLDKIAQKKL